MAKPGTMSASVIHVTVLGLCMILVYSTFSGLAGVYSEYILKDKYDVRPAYCHNIPSKYFFSIFGLSMFQ